MEEKYFSAHEEEKIINKYLDKDPNKEIGIYIDIGASLPIENNNTYYYYLRNWIGLSIDPHPAYFKVQKEIRPRDIFESIAITNYDGEIDMVATAVDKSIHGKYLRELYSNDLKNACYKVKCLTLNSLIKKYPKFIEPDILSIDIETHEDKALSVTNFSLFKPKIMLIEYLINGFDYRTIWEKYIHSYYIFKETIGANALYVRRTI